MVIYSEIDPKEIGKDFYKKMLEDHVKETGSQNNEKSAASVMCYETYAPTYEHEFTYRPYGSVSRW